MTERMLLDYVKRNGLFFFTMVYSTRFALLFCLSMTKCRIKNYFVLVCIPEC